MNARHEATSAPRLRLVGRDEPTPARGHPAERPLARQQAARQAVARENLAAASSAPHDPRLAFAGEVKLAMEGGKAALLRPERRRELFHRAEDMGLRPFDANLVIAIVQEAARRGEDATIPERKPQSPHANLRVLSQLLPQQARSNSRDEVIRFAFIAAGLAICILAGLIAAMGR